MSDGELVLTIDDETIRLGIRSKEDPEGTRLTSDFTKEFEDAVFKWCPPGSVRILKDIDGNEFSVACDRLLTKRELMERMKERDAARRKTRNKLRL